MLDREFDDRPEWLDVSRETFEALWRFADLVRHWTQRINLISPGTVPQLWERHVLDSAQLYFQIKTARVWVDLGSGGGFPGIVLAILARNTATRFHLVESDQRKAAFLRKAASDMGLNVQIHAARAEQLVPLEADIVTARALAPLESLLPLVARHLAPNGIAILPKGVKAAEEIAQARTAWTFDLAQRASMTDPLAQILTFENLRHV